MFNSRSYYNSRPDGFGVLEIPAGDNSPRRFAPLKRTDLAGDVTGPLAALRLTQTFAIAGSPKDRPMEALYRFPLPGDAAVTSVHVRFGDVEIRTTLKERSAAENEYRTAVNEGRQAALLTRESVDVFTVAVAGIRPGQEVRVETAYVQLARAERDGWSLRIPLTTSPRYVRADETPSRHAEGQPLAILRDPGHRFALDLTVRGAAQVTSPTHTLAVDGERIRLRDGEVIPDRDCVLTWRPASADRPALSVWLEPDPAAGRAYFMALCTAPAKPAAAAVPREVIVLVDHSGSMEGPKWEAADWAVERFLAGLTERDRFALGLFHNTTRWLARETRPATPDSVRKAVGFLKEHRDSGGTELGVALEQALDLPRTADTPARHVLVITDAEVTDSGRLLRLLEGEADRTDRRRVSVLCIDAAPHAALATELAERGGGVSRFLTSDPAEDDVTTALDDVLADWSAPAYAGLTLEVNRPAAEAVGRLVSLRALGSSAGIDLGDPPAGRPIWVAGGVPLAGGQLTFRLTAGSGVLTDATVDPATGGVLGLKALVGAQRIRRLEYLMLSGLFGRELGEELDRLGFDPALATGDAAKVYPENAWGAAEAIVKPLLVQESLAFGIPSAETAFVATRTEAGRRLGETLVVASALPAGWSDEFAIGGAGGKRRSALRLAAAPSKGGTMRKVRTASQPGLLGAIFGARPAADYDADDDEGAPKGRESRISVAAGRHPTGDGAVLFDSDRDAKASPIPTTGRLTALSVAVRDKAVTADAVGPELALLVFVGDLTSPRARVRVADVLRAGRRPLNLRRDAGQPVRLVVADPDGKWKGGVPALEVTLSWEG
ncbi:MAG TPA: VIT domain-containing protein [Gemmataceae bacterium]|nr:VIT domain-containing protein [Gemmataceae bacterium]